MLKLQVYKIESEKTISSSLSLFHFFDLFSLQQHAVEISSKAQIPASSCGHHLFPDNYCTGTQA